MREIFISLFFAIIFGNLVTSIKAVDFILEKEQSIVEFNIKEFRRATVVGYFKDVDAKLQIEPETKILSNVNATINVSSVFTNSKTRDRHLRKDKKFFDVKNFPIMSFSSNFQIDLDQTFITGNIKIKNINKIMRLPIVISAKKIQDQTYLNVFSH